MHNDLRSVVAKGGAKSRNVMPLPTATRMRKIRYSMELEKIANQVASQCNIAVHTVGKDFVENFAVYLVKKGNTTQGDSRL
jgi:hypothetical protein